jgi:ABC-2 type transport system permease protein
VRTFLLLVRMRVRDVTRKTSTFVFLFGLPIVLLAIVSLVFLEGHPFERRHVVVVGDARVELPGVSIDRETLERAAIARLESRMASAVLSGNSVIVGERDTLFGRGITASIPNTNLVTRALPRLGYVRYLLPGLVTFSVVIAGLFGIGYAMLRYRESLFLKKLATTPLRRSTFVAAQIVARAALSIAQTILLLAVAIPALGLSIPLGGWMWLILLTTLGVLTFLGIGFAIAALVRSEGLLADVISAATTPLVLLSEIFFPVDVLPGVLPAVASALPTTQMVRMIRSVLVNGSVEASAMLPGIANMTVWMVVTFAIAVWSFRWT